LDELSYWTERELADEMVKQCIVEVSPHVMWTTTSEGANSNHRSDYWLTPGRKFDAKVRHTQLYAVQNWATKLRAACAIDEMTGIQALERLAPDLPLRPGKVQRREFEYIRLGTQT